MRDGFIKVAVASPRLKVANTEFNVNEIIKTIENAKGMGVKLLCFPELSITSYTCQDLFLQDTLLDAALKGLEKIVISTEGSDIIAIVGLPIEKDGSLYNTAAVIQNGKVLAFIPKTNIPEYGEFYEGRWFSEAPDENLKIYFMGKNINFGTGILIQDKNIKEFVLSVEICEDLWVPISPSLLASVAGATVIANLSASSESVGKDEFRRDLVKIHSAKCLSAYLYSDANSDESTTDMVFGAHNIICENGTILKESHYSNELQITDIDVKKLISERRRMNTYSAIDSGYIKIYSEFQVEKTSLDRRAAQTPFVPKKNKRKS